jgi:hypothetical protein
VSAEIVAVELVMAEMITCGGWSNRTSKPPAPWPRTPCRTYLELLVLVHLLAGLDDGGEAADEYDVHHLAGAGSARGRGGREELAVWRPRNASSSRELWEASSGRKENNGWWASNG